VTTARSKSRGQTGNQTGGRTRGRTMVQEEVTEEPRSTLFDLQGDDDVIYIWRIHPVSKKLVFMFRLSQEEGTEEEIQRLAGGGKYMCREKGRNEEGLMVFGKSRTVEIGGAPREPKVPKATQAEIDAAPSENPAPVVGVIGEQKKGATLDDALTAGIIRLLTSQAEVGETQAKMYQTMMTRPERPQTNWGPIITACVPLLTSMIERKDNAPNPMEMIEKIASLMKTNTNPTSQFKDMLETVDSVFSIKEQAAGPAPDPLTALTGQLPKILEIISSEQKTRGRIPTPEEVQRRLATTQPTQPSQPGAQPKMPMYQALLNRFSPMLRDWAARGQDPVQAGEYIVASIPEQHHGAVREFLAREDSEELVYQTIPDLRNYPDFTQQCFGAIADMFEPDEEEVPFGGALPNDVAQPTEPAEVLLEVDSAGVGRVADDDREEDIDLIEETTDEETVEEVDGAAPEG